MAILETRSIRWPDEATCADTAVALAARPAVRDAFIELRGTLGAGKTTFVRHLLQALGVTGRIKSPTYAVMEPYELPLAAGPGQQDTHTDAWHFDFYRFKDPREWEDAGFRDIFASRGLKLAEWPEQAEGLLPEPDLRIDIEPVADATQADAADADAGAPDTGGGPRVATFTACSRKGLELLP